MLETRFHTVGGPLSFAVGEGFQIQYKALQPVTDCGGVYSNAKGVLSSPSHPKPYPELASCVYLISQPDRKYINISFISFDIDCHVGIQRLLSDFFEMRDGKTEESPLMGRFCGNATNIPPVIQTTQNHLRIR